MWLKHMNMSGEEEKVGRSNCQRGQITPELVGQGEESPYLAGPPEETPELSREQRKPGALWTIVCAVVSLEGMGEQA